MFVHRSNRTERLVAALVRLVREPVGDPFRPECITVQGRGMERWLAMELARHLGVWANPDFPFPRRLIERVLQSTPGRPHEQGNAFEPERLLWSIRALLPELQDRPQLAPIRNYLTGDDRGVRALQLADRIADTFDHYVVHRPDLVLDWEHGGGDAEDWQPLLWRALVERHGAGHVAARARDFLAAADANRLDAAKLPRRVSLFGISTLPPLYVRVLAALSRHVDVHLFVLTPSREYWAQIRSERQIVRALARAGTDPGQAEERLHYEVGHPLLAALGRLGREFQEVLEEFDYREGDDDLYDDPGCGDALHALQSDILSLRHRGAPDGPPRLELRADDASIRIHSCHGAMREVEVLHDQLLALFEEIPDLAPHEVVVMTPDIEEYAPAIEAVFASSDGTTGRAAIPYRISDRGPRGAAEVIDAFERVLDLLTGRMKAPEVLDLLGIRAVRDRFGIAAGDLELLRQWVSESGIRWGVDAAHREAEDQPALDQNTWRFGLDRLLLGYAIGDESTLFGGTLPYVDVEGQAGQLLGSLVELLETLFRLRERLAVPRTVAEWSAELRELVAATIADDPTTADQVQDLTGTLADLAERAEAAGFAEAIPLEAYRAQLESDLRRRISTHGFLSRGVCFCELVPMRTIPFRVVCLLGMSDGAFPRSQRPLGFDLMARRPRPGDRSVREDDRYLFLEALLAARERLVVSYVGQGIRDNGPRPPSVVVSDLLDALEETYDASVRERVEVAHPLQPFDGRYFDGEDPGLFSFRGDRRDGAIALRGPRLPRPPFVAAPIPADPPTEIDLDDLVEFFRHPSRWFARNRLDLRMGRETEPVKSREPIALDALERWSVGSKALAGRLRGATAEEMFERLRAGGELPPGTPGRLTFDRLFPEAERAAQAAQRHRAAERRSIELDESVGGVRVFGRIDDLYGDDQVVVHFSRLRGRQDLGPWVRHVFLCLAAPAGTAPSTVVVGRAQKARSATAIRFGPVAKARAIAEKLVALHRAGTAAPLPFFPSASREFADKYGETGDEEKARAAAVKQPDHPATTARDPFRNAEVDLLFRGRDAHASFSDPTDGASAAATFREAALDVYRDLIRHEEDA